MSSDQLFLITAAAGNTGAPTVEMLLDAGHRVRAFVHRSDRRSEALAGLGAEIVEGDLLDFHAVSSAMSGVSAAYFCYPIAPGSLPDFFVQHISSVAQDYQDGIFSGENNLVEVISGRKPMTVGDYVDANRAAFDHDGNFAVRDQRVAS